ncbi:crotonobetainyl-CoA:carnitine CoA-transferase CaiB-like acyl-CoA transferase [Kaistia hirudinis]|uniref:Crotonobetainyl-CoA:carnitine CoA-transferase CaiB-like acyl-CoA transferase n=1 Tax=Kaistia hirudinis TaxID=1293440 RepID=A0A840AQ41_9HYPH|nr:CaiB/BaiF CoA-transferase family protein [Kaistia hirudinis]MBB3931742.1 crotonobetainyl-CoA:carnitine CoA-transferase CaiB-like acyl-CoA transferase [Kaistia hirudinis]MBN9016375.1 CoA transferase [Hyphomicrobiales bacterium]
MEKALSGVTILDFSHLLQGPFATQLLADMGADVIKIERAGPGDLFRSMTFFAKWVGGSESPNFLAWNRNKRSIALNLKSRKVHAIIMEMAKKADVVVQNFRPGVLDRLGYGYDDFKAVNPRIVYCSGSGYGEEGPYLERPGQDMLIQGLVGLQTNTGRGDGPPIPAGSGLADQIGAMNMVYGILSALYWREKSGKGQKVEVNLMAGMLAHLGQEYCAVMNLGEDFVRPNSGIGHPGMQAPFGVYETRDGRYVSIAMSPFKTLYTVLEAPHLAVYDDLETLFKKRDEVWEKVNAETSKFDSDELLERLFSVDIWAAPVQDIRAATEDPQVVHMKMITSYEHPKAGTVKVVAPAVGMSETPPSIDRPAPMVGEHGREILAEFGFAADEIDALEASGDMTIERA